MSKPKLTLFVDIRSGFTYLAFTLISTSPIFSNCDVTYIPIDLRALWTLCSNPGSWAVKNKPAWIRKSCLLWSQRFSIPFNGPPANVFENSTTDLMRAVCCVSVKEEDPEKLIELLRALYKVFWVESGTGIFQEGFISMFEEVLGREKGREMVEMSETEEAVGMLERNTKMAMDEGAFGLPYYIATNAKGEKETFWGFDHLGMMADHLGLERPLPGSSDEGGWKVMM